MELIRDIQAGCLKAGRPAISFEFFPPKTEEGERNFFERVLPDLVALGPDFCSVTYGAGGTTRDKTLGIVERIQRDHRLTAMTHLTCVGSTRDQLVGVLEVLRPAIPRVNLQGADLCHGIEALGGVDQHVLLAFAAKATSRIRLGPLLANPVTRHPSVTAGSIATVDQVSDGRAILGYGIGALLVTGFGRAVLARGEPPFMMPWQLPAGTFVLVMAICCFSALLGIRKVWKVEPAIVFRG